MNVIAVGTQRYVYSDHESVSCEMENKYILYTQVLNAPWTLDPQTTVGVFNY